MEFLYDTGAYFSHHGHLNLPRTDSIIEIYSDASHSPGGDKSTQCVLILWRGSPLVWESSRQPFTTLSSAESELVSMVHSIQLAESVQPLVGELLCEHSTLSLMGDNAAAVRSFEAAGSGWRNRHLRMRAVAGRERILAGGCAPAWRTPGGGPGYQTFGKGKNLAVAGAYQYSQLCKCYGDCENGAYARFWRPCLGSTGNRVRRRLVQLLGYLDGWLVCVVGFCYCG